MYHVLTMLELKSKIKCVLAQDSKFFTLKKKNRERECLCRPTRCWCSGNSRTETPPMFNGKVDGC